jgi:O6-methylguanine-DNA--protein-cysteine methyltransferase
MVMIERPDAIVTALRGLAADAPSGLGDTLFGSWSIAPSRLGEVFVVGTRAGVQFVRSVESMHSDEAAFAQAYRVRFGRPLRPADRAPGGLLAALAGRPGGAVQLDLSGSSEFEQAVLAATRRIPNGQTRP